MMRIGILGSTRGSHLTTLVNAIQQKLLSANIELVISNKETAGILEKAKEFQLQHCYINPNQLTREQYDEKISLLFKKQAIDLIILTGYMRILSSCFVNQWSQKIINIHPSLLPRHAGKMDLDVHRSVLFANEKETGCTVHYVTEIVDAGPIILQSVCEVLPDDTPESLKTRVQQLEAPTLIAALQRIIFK